MYKKLALSLLAFAILLLTSLVSIALADDDDDCDERTGYQRVEVSGKGIHDFNTKLVHRSKRTETGLREISTETIDLSGDLEGRVLYQPKGVYDFVNRKLVNTGRQVFSGTVHGSRPVVLFDDEFRFEVDLDTGRVKGQVYLSQSLAGPKMRCEIEITDDGVPPVDNRTSSSYKGVCWIRKKDN